MSIPYITIIIIIILLIVYFTINFKSVNIDFIDYQLRGLYHANLSHLFGNAISFLFLSGLETIMGHIPYLLIIIFIFVVSNIFLLITHTIIPSLKVMTVGFSGTIMGLAVVYIYYAFIRKTTNPNVNNNGGLNAMLIVGSLLPQIFLAFTNRNKNPEDRIGGNISVEGHLCGVAAGVVACIICKFLFK